MRVIGTAGHVDHGKSTLVQALTGINPDRLQEEQERQMTIDLGFAWLTLPNGEEVGIIDVPGHRDFIENMLAGVGALDGALLVIAADEGVMPQTREHLAILDLLQVDSGVVALAKTDLLQDADWLDLVREDVQSVLEGTTLADAPILPVSAILGSGLEELVGTISAMLSDRAVSLDRGKPRLLIDRAFTIAGFGTVVTGTLVDGELALGQEVEILPAGRRARVRNLQTHKSPVETAVPGSRVAANLSGVEVKNIQRGDVLVRPGSYQPTGLLDVHFRMLADTHASIRHNQTAKLFLGTSQRMARVRLLGADVLHPGDEGWLQLVLSAPVVATRGDRFILRRASPGTTLGGGSIAEPHPARFYKRSDEQAIRRLEQLVGGQPSEILLQSLIALGPTVLINAIEHAGLIAEAGEQAAQSLRDAGHLYDLESDAVSNSRELMVLDGRTWESLRGQTTDLLSSYHNRHPLRLGMPREQLKSLLGLDAKPFAALISTFERDGILFAEGSKLRLAAFQIELSEAQGQAVDHLLQRFVHAPQSPPSVKECRQAVGDELLAFLIEGGSLIKLSDDVVMEDSIFQLMAGRVRSEILAKGQITVAEARDLLDTSRKYALALMEYLDAEGVTFREGDVRKLVGAESRARARLD